MVSLIGHSGDARTPASTGWVLSGAVTVGLLALIVTPRALGDAERLDIVYRAPRLGSGGGCRCGYRRRLGSTGPVAVTLLLVGIVTLLWCFAGSRFLRVDARGDEPSVHQ